VPLKAKEPAGCWRYDGKGPRRGTRRRVYRICLGRGSGVNGVGAFQFRKRVDGFACFLLGEAQFVEALQIEPELGAGAKEVSEAEGCVAGDRAGTVEDLSDPVGGDANFSGELSGAHVERIQLFCKVLAWVNGSDWHGGLLMIVDNFNARGPRRTAGPLEADSPLIVDANTELALAIATQRLEPIAGQCR
jgi:hypothetical protein